MQYADTYKSPLCEIFLTADDTGLTGLWFSEKEFCESEGDKLERCSEFPVFKQAKKWLDIYFTGREPDFRVPVHFIGTVFQKDVWELLYEIPYGKTVTYGDIAKRIAEKYGIKKMSAQAVGGAVGHNKISIIVPCHRVMGANGNLTGYASGVDLKIKLLKLEGAYEDSFYYRKQDIN